MFVLIVMQKSSTRIKIKLVESWIKWKFEKERSQERRCTSSKDEMSFAVTQVRMTSLCRRRNH